MSDRFSFETKPLRRRGHVVMQALFHGAIASVLLGFALLALAKMVGGDGGFIVLLFLTMVFGLIFGYRASHFLRDLGSQPSVAEGEVRKKWSKANFLFFFLPGYYMAVEEDEAAEDGNRRGDGDDDYRDRGRSQIYSIERSLFAGLLEGDHVRILRYPHSLTIEEIERYDTAQQIFVPVEGDPP